MKIAVVGVTGLVGRKMVAQLEGGRIEELTLIPVASTKSVGREIPFRNQLVPVVSMEEALTRHPHVALFSAGTEISQHHAPRFAAQGTYVIDNSAAFRREEAVPLVVPEINGSIIRKSHHLIANPNCTTAQLVMALAPLKERYGLHRVVASTYQSVSGSGKEALEQLFGEREGRAVPSVYPWPIHNNIIPHGGSFLPNGFTAEEDKLLFETRKILAAPEMEVAATVARVPVTGGHSISATITCHKACPAQEVTALLKETPGVVVLDDPLKNEYPMPLFSEGKDEVFVGRIRNDLFHPDVVMMWIVSDNLHKGAATNAVQILEYLVREKIVA
ncbi:MAG: aspartate-semialdehyde dehydrogenase [Bacteroidetes bacterium]|nr:MAG: aspartate-semialdehyde dehydrogenase [Bacteroidota bacterium]PIE88151.1 MAG: aspartate-semialdehyde dehydrogenase [Bacteroidota bacterium]